MFCHNIVVNSAKANVAKDIEANANRIAKGSNSSKLDYIDITCIFVQFIN